VINYIKLILLYIYVSYVCIIFVYRTVNYDELVYRHHSSCDTVVASD